MLGFCGPGPKFLARLTCLDARSFSVRTGVPGCVFQFKCVLFFRSGPKSLAVFTHVNARRRSVRTKVPGDVYQCKCVAFFGQGRNSWRNLAVRMRGAFHSEPKFLAIFLSLNAGRFSVRTEVPVDVYQFECKVFFREDRNSWRRVLVS